MTCWTRPEGAHLMAAAPSNLDCTSSLPKLACDCVCVSQWCCGAWLHPRTHTHTHRRTCCSTVRFQANVWMWWRAVCRPRVRGETYRSGIVKATPAAAWYAANEWCVKCNLFGDSPCREDYLAFNVHRERMAEAGATSTGGPGTTSAGGSAGGSGPSTSGLPPFGPEEATLLDDYIGSRLMTCFMSNPTILTPDRMRAAERAAVLSRPAPPPAPHTGSTHDVLAELRSRLGALEAVSSTVSPPPHLANVPVPAPSNMSTRELSARLLFEVRQVEKALGH